jgi:hypothetical protein
LIPAISESLWGGNGFESDHRGGRRPAGPVNSESRVKPRNAQLNKTLPMNRILFIGIMLVTGVFDGSTASLDPTGALAHPKIAAQNYKTRLCDNFLRVRLTYERFNMSLI